MPDHHTSPVRILLSLIVWSGVFMSAQHSDTISSRLLDEWQLNPHLAVQDAHYDLARLLASMEKRVMIGVFGTDAAQLDRDLENLRYQLALTQTESYRQRFEDLPGALKVLDETSGRIEESQDRIRALRPGDVDDFAALQEQLTSSRETLSQLVERSQDWSQNRLVSLKQERDFWAMVQYGLIGLGTLLSASALIRRKQSNRQTVPAITEITETTAQPAPQVEEQAVVTEAATTPRRKLFARARVTEPVVASSSPVEAPEIVTVAKTFDTIAPTSILDDMMRDISPWTDHRGLSLASTISPDVPAHLVACGHDVRQALGHLVGNAVKFTHHGGIVIAADLTDATPDQDAQLRFSVLDTGIGIEPGYRDLVFGEQVQVDPDQAVDFSAFDQQQRGLGNGLADVRHLVTQWGGQIGVESKPGLGSRFWFTLPILDPGAPIAAPDQILWQSILIVDSDTVRSEAIADQCSALGAQVTMAEHGFAAIESILLNNRNNAAKGKGAFDLVVIAAPFGPASIMPLLRQFDQLPYPPHQIALAMPESYHQAWQDIGLSIPCHILSLPVPTGQLLGLLDHISQQPALLESMRA